jgi:subtilisin family serine protease
MRDFIANIEKIRAATLESFWQEPEIPFPGNEQNVWWEVWLDRENGTTTLEQKILDRLHGAEVQVGSRILVFPEHLVVLVKGTSVQLGKSLLYTDQLAEIRKPAETADFFTYLDKEWEGRFIDDLNRRTIQVADSNISVCLLDTGVNRTHPLLKSLIPEANLDSIEPDWVQADTDRYGHGTPMAGLILYGDLTDAFSSIGNIQIVHHLESVKILERTRPNEPDLYGKVTLEAISRGEIINPNNKRIACMAVTAPANQHLGRPSSWSSAIDQILFGSIEDRNDRTLILVSSGNLPLEARLESPLSNDDFSIQDPAQAFNALTIGSYTLKDRLNLEEFPGAELLARRGGMALCNATALCWENQWSRKPDIVMEGGNDGIFNGGICDPDSLRLLSTGKGELGRSWLTTFGDTSASTALASKVLAKLYYEYPDLWPETIRGLIIHSAGWTPAMLNNRDISDLSSEEQRNLLARVGYGVPK